MSINQKFVAVCRTGMVATVVSLVGMRAEASGFGLYEASAKTYALGGAVIGKAVDASANFHNPATLTDLTNITVSVGFMTEHPRGRMKVHRGHELQGSGYYHMDPGVFVLPSFQMAVPLWWDFTFGLGIMPEYGLGSAYDVTWPLTNNSEETTVTSITVNPNLAFKITDKWSVGGGLRFLFFDFEQYSNPYAYNPAFAGTPYENVAIARLRNRLKGDNNMKDFGWQIGTKYDITDNFSVGVVYKSQTKVNVDGKSETHGVQDLLAKGAADQAAAKINGPAETELTLPQSITAGFNWDITKTVHLGGMVGWTEWSSVDVLDFNLNGTHKDIILNWNNTWRAGLAPSWEFAEDWTLLGSYVFETDCTHKQESTMLPGSERHMISLGLDWRISGNWSCCLTYGMILMDGQKSHARGANNELWSYEAHRALSHAAGFTVTYKF